MLSRKCFLIDESECLRDIDIRHPSRRPECAPTREKWIPASTEQRKSWGTMALQFDTTMGFPDATTHPHAQPSLHTPARICRRAAKRSHVVATMSARFTTPHAARSDPSTSPSMAASSAPPPKPSRMQQPHVRTDHYRRIRLSRVDMTRAAGRRASVDTFRAAAGNHDADGT